ncbi:polysaccharide synthase [Aspergillus candidus]|uniref:Polysaccharide synthase n=1 Tax=Aspergillus candidus TaxID=41067 RepID=A0A2I2F850_ASPCN|nr:polysaccharide synthase [Aspergillus candidus]PLB36807.1 polysaccharide synthase [Aspergillus candidus]
MAVALGALWAWSVLDKAVISYFASKYKPVPLPVKQNYTHNDVSIIVPTIDTESTFTECMRLWLKANPREIVIATVERNKARVEELIEPLRQHADKIVIVISPLANKRHQLIVGVKAAMGKIFALVDDDVYWRVGTVVPYLLAPFEDAQVGAVAGIQSAEVPSNRQDARVITPWEATATFDLCQWKGSREVHFAADGGCWCLSARTLFIRASILQDKGFADAYTQETIGRRIVNTADDVVLTGMIFDRGWKVSIQNTPKAEVTTNIPRDHRLVWQLLRWERGNVRTFLGYMFVFPGYRKMMQRHPYTVSKMVERLARPIWALAYVWAWFQTWYTSPLIAYTYIAWLAFGWKGWFPTCRAFLERHPYCRRQVWAFLLMEYIGPFIDVYVYLTMNNDEWLTRTADKKDIKV